MKRKIGYVYPGMEFITPAEARKILEHGGVVFRLNDDNSEGMIDRSGEVEDTEQYGLEIAEFNFDRYLKNRVDKNGEVLFSHGTDDLDDLLDLAEEFLVFAKTGLRKTECDGADMVIRRIKKCREPEHESLKKKTWDACVSYLNLISPFKWKFGNFSNGGLDYVFVKVDAV